MGQLPSSYLNDRDQARDRSFARRSFFMRKAGSSPEQARSYERKKSKSKSSSHTEMVVSNNLSGFVPTYVGPSMTLSDEQERCNVQHDILRFLLKGIHLAQLSRPPKRILDVGTGTGIWIRDAASKFPRAQLIGVDVCDAYRNYPQPANVAYDASNMLNGLDYPDGYFDYVFQRFMNNGIPATEWRSVVRELGRLCKRGGTIELTEYLMTMDPPGGSASERVRSFLYEFYSENGVDMSMGARLEAMIKEELRWSDVYTRIVKIPMGEWAGVSGQLMKKTLQGSIEYTIPEGLRQPNTMSRDVDSWEELAQREALVEEFWREVEEYNMCLQLAIVVAKRPD